MKLPRLALPALALAGLLPAAEPALTFSAAREAALKAHPRITVARLRTLIAHEGEIEARGAYLPLVGANATLVRSGQQITRITSGTLSNSQIFDHVGVGATLSLLVTDFGRTASLNEAARQRARAAEADALATRAQLLLEVDAAYFDALRTHAVQAVARQTLAARQAQFERTRVLAESQLKSELDVRFARVAVDEARLLVDSSEKDWRVAAAILGDLIGATEPIEGGRLEVPAAPGELPAAAEPLAAAALQARPELQRQRAEAEALRAAARAARDATRPTLSLVASAGYTPMDDPRFERKYSAGALNLSVPLFAGGIYRSRERQASAQAEAAEAALQDRSNLVVRDVRLAWLEAGHARERMALTQSLLENAEAALTLARSRFEQGLSSTVELTQAELARTSAEIARTTADFSYRVRRTILDYQTGALR